jgi:hypothetical protein
LNLDIEVAVDGPRDLFYLNWAFEEVRQ